MTSKLSLSSSVSSATLVAINSISAATVAAEDKQNYHAVATNDPLKVVSVVEQDDITSALDNTEREERLFTPRSSSTAAMKPDVGILSKDFLKNKGRETVGKQFAIHRKKRAVAVDVDVGILRRRNQQQISDANLHAENEVTGRSLQSEEELPEMCGGWDFDDLFDETYFPKCSCPSPTTCGPEFCECLELDADGDIFQCMDSFKQLCEGTMYIDGIPGPWSMEKCLGSKSRAIRYCSMLPCFVDGGSYMHCNCQSYDRRCTEYRSEYSCARSKCCQAQTDDEGREACIYGDLHENYYDQVISFSKTDEEMVSSFNECSFNSDSGKSIVQCYCESFTYGNCVNNGVGRPELCEANICCYEQTEDDARLDCFSRFRDGLTGWDFYHNRDTIQESCVASGRSSDQCKCDILELSNCVFGMDRRNREPQCDLFECCQSQTGDDNDEGRKNCILQDAIQSRYETCINDGIGSSEFCYCNKSSNLCSSGHSNGLYCELAFCCREQADDAGRKECIGNFTTSQPSSAPSESNPPTAASALPGTSSASIPTLFAPESLTKTRVLAVAAITVWLLLT
jgi:hypothetical protein